ncbi:GSCOCT00013138001.2-RA-CDS [Cotesia congregata]|uniref:Anionic trypsin-like n=1 Tax=Cotesia congregata TaxID=51543 RepID=A0A8J2HBI9_COTCN|nr:GSCOCT00013138001.2-RA-CDS [Cotesia congregata]CAG5093010.1 anionic trypsin-like [Cotesia congregata]
MDHFIHIAFILAIFLPLGIDGKPPRKIVGGISAKINDFPCVVSIEIWGQHFCGGALVSKKHVLTAAHCLCTPDERTKTMTIFDENALKIAAGSSSSKHLNQVYEVEKINVHPAYTGESPLILHDLGIITMKEEAVLDATVQVVNLPTDYCYAGQLAIVLGWGYLKDKGGATSEWLQKAPVLTLSNEDCMQKLPYPIEQDHICGWYGQGVGFCDGDSGGPLLLNGEIVGVVSMGYVCGSGLPDIYTRVYSYLPWIRRVIRSTYH